MPVFGRSCHRGVITVQLGKGALGTDNARGHKTHQTVQNCVELVRLVLKRAAQSGMIDVYWNHMHGMKIRGSDAAIHIRMHLLIWPCH